MESGLTFLGKKACQFSWFDHVCPKDRNRLHAFYQQLQAGKESTIEYRILREDSREQLLVREIVIKHTAPDGAQSLEGILISLEDNDRLLMRCLSIEDEQKMKLGQELHDDVCQQLAALKFFSSNLASKLVKKNLLEELEVAQEISEQIQVTIDKVRALSHGLNPQTSSELILEEALDGLKQQVELLYGISCQVHIAENHPFNDTNTVMNLFRIAQEAVQNAMRHGQASQIDISLKATSNGWKFSICDNGKGKTADFLSHEGMGLHNMKTRANVVGASFVIQDNPNQGIGVACTTIN